MLLFVVNVWRSLRYGATAGADPWGAGTLEWSTRSPPPAHNFDAMPVVAGAIRCGSRAPGSVVNLGGRRSRGADDERGRREPDTANSFRAPTIWPFSARRDNGAVHRSIFTPWAVVWASPVGRAARDVVLAAPPRRARHRERGTLAMTRAPDSPAARRRTESRRSMRAPAELRLRQSKPDVVGHGRSDGDRGHGVRAR